MSFKKIIAVLAAFCFLTTFIGQNFAQAATAAQSKNNNEPMIAAQSVIIPERFGKITESANYNSPQVIVTIQDLHAHPQVQKNIASILGVLDEKYDIKTVYSEGASGKVDISWLSSGENSELKHNIVLQMIENGVLTGAEYFAFLNDKNNLFGLEDAEVHHQNIVRLGTIYENEAKNLAVAAKVKNEINYLAGKNLNKEVKRFSKSAEQYHGNKTEPAKYYAILLDYAEKINANPQNYYNTFNIDIEEFTELQKVVLIDKLSKKLNTKYVNLQLQKYLSSLKDNISFSEYRSLLDATNNFSDIDMLYKYISERGFDGKTYPQLQAFLKIKELNAQVNPLNLFAQEQRLEDQIRKSLASSDTEREIAFLNYFYALFEGCLTNKLTAKDEEYFKRNFSVFNDIYGKYASVNHLNIIKDSFAFLNDYYETNNKRNEIFIQKINEHDKLVSGGGLSALPAEEILKNAKEIIVIVTGGYHTVGINDILSSKKVSHITITPKISESTDMAEMNFRQIIIDQSRIYKEALLFVIASKTPDTNRSKILTEAGLMVLGKNTRFDDIDIDNLLGQIDTVAGGERQFTVDKTNDNATIQFNNGAVISIFRGEDGKIAVDSKAASAEKVMDGGVKISDKSLVKVYLDMTKILSREALKNLYAVAILDIENDSVYKMAKSYFTECAEQGIYMGADGPIPKLGEYARKQLEQQLRAGNTSTFIEEIKDNLSIDGISYNFISKMPEWFQEEAFKRHADSKKKEIGMLNTILRSLLSIMVIAFTSMLIAACSGETDDNQQQTTTPPGIEQQETIQETKQLPKNLTNWRVSRTAQEFLQGKGNPVPRSFTGKTHKITDYQQKMIAEQGVIIYDMAVLMKALLLFPDENRDLIEKMFNALERNKHSNTSNADFTYGDNDTDHSVVPVGQGYYWKILRARDNPENSREKAGGGLQDQYQPITGENAWYGNALVSMAQVYQGSDSDLGNRAYQRAVELARAMLALKIESGAIRMAPKDNVSNYSYMKNDIGGYDNYYELVSMENNVSVYSFLKNLHDFTNDAELKSDLAAALFKLENYLFSMYDKEKGYFLSGVDLKTELKDEKFATDCQTWIISVFGAKNFDEKMKDRFGIDNASVELLKRALKESGVKGNRNWKGLDFSKRAEIVSFEWTISWLIAAREALEYSDDAELKNAVKGIATYVNAKTDRKGILKYVNADGAVRAFSWDAMTGLGSLASTAWQLFYSYNSGDTMTVRYGTTNMYTDIQINVYDSGKNIITPFDVFKPARKVPPFSRKKSAQPAPPSAVLQSREIAINVDNVKAYGADNWLAYVVNLAAADVANIDKGAVLEIEIKPFDAPRGSVITAEAINLDENDNPIPQSNIVLNETYNIPDDGSKAKITIPLWLLFDSRSNLKHKLDKNKNLQVILNTGKDFDGEPHNLRNAVIEITGIKIIYGTDAKPALNSPLELPFLSYTLNRLGITMEKFPKIRTAIVAFIETLIVTATIFVPEKFIDMHGEIPENKKDAMNAEVLEILDKAKNTGFVYGMAISLVIFAIKLTSWLSFPFITQLAFASITGAYSVFHFQQIMKEELERERENKRNAAYDLDFYVINIDLMWIIIPFTAFVFPIFIAQSLLGALLSMMISIASSLFKWNLNNPKPALDRNVRVNMIYASEANLKDLQAHFGKKVMISNDGIVSQNVFIMNQPMPDGTNLDNFSGSGVNAIIYKLKSTGRQIPSSRLSEFKPEDIESASIPVLMTQSESEGIIYHALGVPHEDIAATIQNSLLEKIAGKSLKENRIFLSDKISVDYIEVDTMSEIKASDFSKSGNLRLYAGTEVGENASGRAARFERARINRNAEAWQRAKSVRIFLDKTTDKPALEKYMKILSNASNGNLIFTEALVNDLIDKKKLDSVIKQLRKDGISIMAEKPAEGKLSPKMPEALVLFDGQFDLENGKIETMSVNKGKEVFDADIISDSENIESSLANAKQDVVIFASALEEYAEKDTGFGTVFSDLVSVKILKYFQNAPITAGSVRETAGYYDIEEVINAFSHVDASVLQEMYDLYKSGTVSAEEILNKQKSGLDNFAGDYLADIDIKVQDENKKIEIKRAFIEGFLNKLAAAIEFKNAGRERGFKDKNLEKLVGEIAAFKYLSPLIEDAETGKLKSMVENVNMQNYLNEISAIIDEYPQAVPAVAYLMLGTIFAYESKANFNRDSLKVHLDLKAMNKILTAA